MFSAQLLFSTNASDNKCIWPQFLHFETPLLVEKKVGEVVEEDGENIEKKKGKWSNKSKDIAG